MDLSRFFCTTCALHRCTYSSVGTSLLCPYKSHQFRTSSGNVTDSFLLWLRNSPSVWQSCGRAAAVERTCGACRRRAWPSGQGRQRAGRGVVACGRGVPYCRACDGGKGKDRSSLPRGRWGTDVSCGRWVCDMCTVTSLGHVWTGWYIRTVVIYSRTVEVPPNDGHGVDRHA